VLWFPLKSDLIQASMVPVSFIPAEAGRERARAMRVRRNANFQIWFLSFML